MENLKSNMTKVTSYIQGNLKTISEFFSKKCVGWKGVAQYIQSAGKNKTKTKTKNLTTKNTLPGKILIQN